MDGVFLTFVRLELPLHEAELFFSPPQFVLEFGNLVRACNGGQQQCLFDSFKQIPLASCVFLVTLRLAILSEHQPEYQGLLSIG